MDDLIAEFITETNEGLQELDTDLVKLEQNPNDKDLISKIFRLMHTIKGTCGFLGLPRLEKVAHHAENVMGRFRDGNLQVTPTYVSLILESLDRVRLLLGHIESNGVEPEGSDAELIEKLDAVYEGRDQSQSSPVHVAAATPSPPEMPVIPEGREPTLEELDAIFAATPVLPQNLVAIEQPQMVAVKTESQDIKDANVESKESSLANQSLRVNVDVLENLMTMVSELVLTRNQLLQISRAQSRIESTKGKNSFSGPLQRLNHVVSDLQDGVMKTRMQPIGNAWAKLPRIIRDLSQELKKKIDLVMIGQDTELDRQILEMIKDPLTHMVRNSGDHGIEVPSDRISAGKSETGTITLKAFHEGGHIIIQIIDDGKGLPMAKIKQKILQNGLATESELGAMTTQQIQQFIFKAGFSTADKITSVSGRGVGMDVVRTNIEKIGGSIELNSIEGKGSTFTIKIPLTLAIVSSLIVESGNERFAIPQLSVNELVLVSEKSDHRIEMIKGTPVFRLRNKLLPLVSLEHLLKLNTEDTVENNFDHKYIIVTQVGAYRFGIIVDRVFDTEEIVVKPVSKILRNIELFSGNTILGDGSVIMILDPGGIAKAAGENEAPLEVDHANESLSLNQSQMKTSLLLFRAGNDTLKAVPLSLVARLENITLSNIEQASGQMMIQYRGKLMPLIAYNDAVSLHTEKTKPVLVFTEHDRSMGLIVDEIIDITEHHINLQTDSSATGILGSTIINGKATELVDVNHYLRAVFADFFKNHGDDPFLSNHGHAGSRKRRVLLIDDSPFFRNMLTPLLSISGYEVVSIESPVKALEMADRGETFDLIISDIEMPDMSGFEFASRVRAGGVWQSIPLLALSSHATPQDMDHGFKVGFNGYVAKFDRDTLLSAINETLIAGERA